MTTRLNADLVMACLHAWFHPECDDRAERLVRGVPDWDAFIDVTLKSGVLPIVHAVLSRLETGIPEPVRCELDACLTAHTLRTTWLTQRLMTLLDLLRANGVAAIPLKGPVLGVVAYGDICLRHFCDLDILVKREDLHRAKTILMQGEYRLYTDVPEYVQRSQMLMGQSFQMISKTGDHSVDIITGPLTRNVGTLTDSMWLWDRTETVAVEGREVPTLSVENQLLFLCVHGCKHTWWRPVWLADIASLLRKYPDREWTGTVALARKLGMSLMLLPGVELTRQVLEIDLPMGLSQAIAADARVGRLAREASQYITRKPERGLRDACQRLLFRLRSRERIRDRASYPLNYVFSPSAHDWQLLPLPAPLFWLYYVIRPVRLAIWYIPRFLFSHKRSIAPDIA